MNCRECGHDLTNEKQWTVRRCSYKMEYSGYCLTPVRRSEHVYSTHRWCPSCGHKNYEADAQASTN